MKEKLEERKGITLIALVITIIILLILSGITIVTLTGKNGLFARTKEGKEETIKGQLKEEIDMAIMDIQIDQVPKGNGVTLESLAGGQLQEKLEGITAELSNNEIIGEYKDYNYSIDEKLNVTIEDKIKGIRFRYKLELQGYTNGNIKLTIEVSSSNGKITNIQVPEGLIANDDGTYTITKNGSYEFIITDITGENLTKILNINKIDKLAPLDFTPEAHIDGYSVTITANAKDSEADSENVNGVRIDI